MQPGQHRLGHRHRSRDEREVAGEALEGVQRREAVGAVGHVVGQEAVGGLGVLAREGPQDVAREQLVDRLVVDHPVSWSATRSFRIAARVRVFTVPSGIASSSAIWTCVLPSK